MCCWFFCLTCLFASHSHALSFALFHTHYRTHSLSVFLSHTLFHTPTIAHTLFFSLAKIVGPLRRQPARFGRDPARPHLAAPCENPVASEGHARLPHPSCLGPDPDHHHRQIPQSSCSRWSRWWSRWSRRARSRSRLQWTRTRWPRRRQLVWRRHAEAEAAAGPAEELLIQENLRLICAIHKKIK